MHNSDSEKVGEIKEELEVLPSECNNLVGSDKRELPKRERRIPKRYVEDSELGLLPQKNSKTVNTIIEEEHTNDISQVCQEPFAELRNLDGISLAEIYDISVISNSSQKHSSIKQRTRFSCDFCKFITLSQTDLIKHIENHRNCALECNECHSIFKRKKDLEHHHETAKHTGYNVINNCNIEKTCSNKVNALPISISANATPSINIIVGTNGQIQSIDTDIVTDTGTTAYDLKSSSPKGSPGSVTLSPPNPAEELKDLLRFDRSGRYKSSNSHRHKTTSYKYVCLKCSKEFDHCSAVRRHYKQSHNDERKYKCQECSAAFKNKTNFVYHMAKHNNVKAFKCSECGKSFTANYDLVTHMRIHTGEQPYTCDICGKHFRHRSNLIVHQRLHSGTKPYKCDICEANFNSTSHLKKHKEFHLSEAQKEADMKYKQEHTIKPKLVGVAEFFRAHYESLKISEAENGEENNDENKNKTKDAQKNKSGCLKNKSEINGKLDVDENKNDQNANKNLSNNNDNKDGVQILNIEILPPLDELGKEYFVKQNEDHTTAIHKNGNEEKQQEHGNDKDKNEQTDESSIFDLFSLPEDFNRIFKFQCQVCYKYFKQKCALTKHIRTHTGERPYSCPWCPRAFSDPSNFKKHKMLHISDYTQRSIHTTSNVAGSAPMANVSKNPEDKLKSVPMSSPTSSTASDPDPDGAELMQKQTKNQNQRNKNGYKFKTTAPASDDTDFDFDDDILDDFTTAKGPLIIWPDFKSNELHPTVLENIEANDQSLLKAEFQNNRHRFVTEKRNECNGLSNKIGTKPKDLDVNEDGLG